ncbi:MAG: DUF1385 domain-containing protein, partial [Coriobacteriales bacterium]|nr:DUF1385 domain-containing protein [Coriobacteriales bacterium]
KTEGVLVKTHIGGQALIEGIMMRGRYNWAVAVREPNGNIYTEEHDLASGKKKNAWMYKPVIRGCTAMVESLVLAYNALEISANHAYDFEEEESGEGDPQGKGASLEDRSAQPPSLEVAETDTPTEGVGASEAQQDKEGEEMPAWLLTLSMALGVVLGIFIFVALPAAITNLIVGDIGEKTLTWNIIDGILRIIVFIGYIWFISLMKDIKRMFRYHGAEHKTIHCFEHGLELTPQNAASFPRLHVRCGTAFLIMTMIIAIFIYTIFPTGPLVDLMGVTAKVPRLLLVILIRILLMPLIAGFAYEVTVKWAGNNPDKPLVKVVLWPGMQMQRLTTKVPDEGMLECAIAAMNIVLERERKEAEAGNAPLVPSLSPCDVAAAKNEG